MISTVEAKSFHVHVLQYYRSQTAIDKTCIILIFQTKKTEVLKSITDLPKIIQEVIENYVSNSEFPVPRPDSLYHFYYFFSMSISVNVVN